MTPAELDELERRMNSEALEDEDSHVLLAAIPALIAKVRAAEELATRVDRALYDFGDDYPGRLDPVSDALDAYRKAGQP